MLWTRGLLVAPPIVYDLLNAMMVRSITPPALCDDTAMATLGQLKFLCWTRQLTV